MEELLSAWGYEDLIESFKENDLNINNIFELTEPLIKELIPSIGKRMAFLQKFNSAKELMLLEVVNIENRPPSPSTTNNNSEVSSAINTNSTTSIVSVDGGSTSTSNNNSEDYFIIPEDNTRMAFCNIVDALTNNLFPDFHLGTLLETSPLGKSILKYYECNQTLDHTHRSRLVDIIVKHIFNFIVKNRLKHDDFNRITSKIIDLFPKECPSTYYIPAIPKRHSNVGKPILAKGRLVDKVRNLLHRSGEGSQLRKKKGAEDLPSADAKRRTVECSNEDAERACLWLKNRQEPWDEVIENWTKTHDFRHCDKNAKTVADFLKQWPILNSQSSQGLIDIDFDLLYPNCGLKLVTNWKHFFETVKRLRHKNIRDETPLLLLNHLQELGEDHCDNIEAVQLYLLSYMIPPKGRLCLENKKHWKFSSQESCDSLIIHAKNCGDIERLMNAQKEKAKAKKLTLQPYVLIEGPTLWEISNCYIVIDDLKYQVPTAMKAIDLCFKVFHVFHAKYPPQSDHIWTLIQKGIYNINTVYDKQYAYINDILENLREVAIPAV